MMDNDIPDLDDMLAPRPWSLKLVLILCCAPLVFVCGLIVTQKNTTAGQLPPITTLPTKPATQYDLHDCHYGMTVADGTIALSSGNPDGYQTTVEYYTCKEGTLTIHGQWADVIQDGYKYHEQMGRLEYREPYYVGDPTPDNPRIAKFEKWCPSLIPGSTIRIYRLCGHN